MSRKNSIEKALSSLKKELGETRLIAVTKTYPAEDIKYALDCGQYDFGENKVQEAKKYLFQ